MNVDNVFVFFPIWPFTDNTLAVLLQSRPIEMRILHRNERCSKACSAHFAPAAYFTAAILFFLPFCE